MVEIEYWKRVPNCPRFEVSNLGRVRGLDPKKGEVTIRSQCAVSHGYLVVNLQYEDGTRKSEPVHSLVCRTFHGERPAGMDCCHNNGDNRDNRASNLRWDTRKANLNDQRIHGTFAWHGNMKLNEKDVLEIVRRIDAGETLNSLAAEYGVAHGVISGINLGNYWPSVTGRKREDAFPWIEKKARSLTKEDVTKIIELLDSGFSQRSIAEAFGVKPQNISDINLGKLWAWHTGRKKEESRPAFKKGQAKHYVKAVLGEE